MAPDDIKTQWQEANANGRMQFKVGDCKDRNIRVLTGTITADWIQLPVERYLTALPTLKQGVITGCSRSRVSLPGPSLGPRSYSSQALLGLDQLLSIPFPSFAFLPLWKPLSTIFIFQLFFSELPFRNLETSGVGIYHQLVGCLLVACWLLVGC